MDESKPPSISPQDLYGAIGTAAEIYSVIGTNQGAVDCQCAARRPSMPIIADHRRSSLATLLHRPRSLSDLAEVSA